ncbi:MAG: hypothetical protein MZW92_79845 [Comamonadaceae bacterium]|nr:hypothetical protein [Comamonadaceae bacterium]
MDLADAGGAAVALPRHAELGRRHDPVLGSGHDRCGCRGSNTARATAWCRHRSPGPCRNGHGCIAGRNLGDAQRASFHYFDGIDHRERARCARRHRASCSWCNMPGAIRPTPRPGRSWRKIWEDRRRGDRNELFRLYRRD